jgi:hypothetical protein
MTIEELHYEFYLLSNKVGGNDRRSFSVSEVDRLLNKAQRVLMNQNVGLFELNNDKTHELATLHIKGPYQPSIAATQHTSIMVRDKTIYRYEVNTTALRSPYYSFTKISATQVKSNCNYRSHAMYLDNDDFEDALSSTFGLDENTIAVNIGRSTTDITPNVGTTSLYIYSANPLLNSLVDIEYIKSPALMNYGGYNDLYGALTTQVQCELPERLQDKLVDLAVTIAYGAINDQGYSIKKDQLNSLS